MSQLLAREFRNEHLSVSRLRLYESCPQAFYFRYADKSEGLKTLPVAPLFGIVLHAALEEIYLWIIREEYSGSFPVERLLSLFQSAWQESELTSVELYQMGRLYLRQYAQTYPEVDHMDILAVEQEFNIVVDGYKLNGYIDRVDKVHDTKIRIVDYKSNWQLFHSDELQNDLQMSAYGLAARTLYPWAKEIEFAFEMLRHNERQYTRRTAAQIDDAAGYVVAIGKRTETDTKWLPRIDSNCRYCDHRNRCDEYKRVIEGRHPTILKSDLDSMGDVLRERLALHKMANIMYARRAELDRHISKVIKEDGEFTVNGVQCRFINPHSTTYDLERVLRVFVEAGLKSEDVRRRVISVDKTAVDELLKETTEKLPKPRALLLKASLEAIAERVPVSPKIDIRELKKPKTADSA